MTPRKKRSKIWKVDKDALIEIVNKSSSLSEVLKYFDLTGKGGNINTLKRRLNYEQIDYSHIKMGSSSNLGRKFVSTKIPLIDVMIENSTYCRSHLKRRILEEKLIEYKCEHCNLTNLWNNKKLVLHLEHKNGISNDNRLENLCFLCPNCHSQTDTYAGKRQKRKHICSCGAKISKNAKLCRKCSAKINWEPRKRTRPSKEQLKEDIKLSNYCAVGRKYGVSDNCIRKWERDYA